MMLALMLIAARCVITDRVVQNCDVTRCEKGELGAWLEDDTARTLRALRACAKDFDDSDPA